MTYANDLDIRSQLRFASQTEADELVRFKLRGAADELDVALRTFTVAPTGEHLCSLVGLWASGKRILNQAGANPHLRNPPPSA